MSIVDTLKTYGLSSDPNAELSQDEALEAARYIEDLETDLDKTKDNLQVLVAEIDQTHSRIFKRKARK